MDISFDTKCAQAEKKIISKKLKQILKIFFMLKIKWLIVPVYIDPFNIELFKFNTCGICFEEYNRNINTIHVSIKDKLQKLLICKKDCFVAESYSETMESMAFLCRTRVSQCL